MDERQSMTTRWNRFRPTKTLTFWSCAAVAVGTMAIGFGAGGWVTGGTSAERVETASSDARSALVASACVQRFSTSPNFAGDLAALKETSSWQQSKEVAKGGWATLAGMDEPLDDAARLCATELVAMEAPPVAEAKPVAEAQPVTEPTPATTTAASGG